MNYQRILVWSLIVLGLFAVVLAIIGVFSRPAQVFSNELTVPVSDNDWYLGPKNAKVTLVEYSDFECPACKTYSTMITELTKDFPDDLRIVYRHFPLSQHQYAKLAARYAEAAGRQGKFWQMTEFIFNGQDQWSSASDDTAKAEEKYFLKYAADLGLNIDRLKVDLNSEETSDKIENDYIGGENSKITYTPTFFLNSKQIDNPRSYEEFKSLIEERIGK